jgi:hypothetical protein
MKVSMVKVVGFNSNLICSHACLEGRPAAFGRFIDLVNECRPVFQKRHQYFCQVNFCVSSGFQFPEIWKEMHLFENCEIDQGRG